MLKSGIKVKFPLWKTLIPTLQTLIRILQTLMKIFNLQKIRLHVVYFCWSIAPLRCHDTQEHVSWTSISRLPNLLSKDAKVHDMTCVSQDLHRDLALSFYVISLDCPRRVRFLLGNQESLAGGLPQMRDLPACFSGTVAVTNKLLFRTVTV